MTEITGGDVIRRTRFLVVDGDKAALDAAEKTLKWSGAPQVYLAPSPIAALRVVQDPKARVDCIICAHKADAMTGLQFLQNLRAGRWGSGKIRHIKFILTMSRLDVETVKEADVAGASGYYVGGMMREVFVEEVAKAIVSERGVSPLPKMKIAHVNMSGVDFIFVPTSAGFAQAGAAEQQQTMGELQALMQEQMLAGNVTPIWQMPDRSIGYFAPPQFHSMLAALTLDFVRANLNRELTVLKPPRHATLSSKGSPAYAATVNAGKSKSDWEAGVLNLSGYEAPAGTEAPRDAGVGPGGVSGGPPPPPAGEPTPEFGGPRFVPERGVHGGPQAPQRPAAPEFGGPGVTRPSPKPK